MAAGFGESSSWQPPSPSFSSNNGNSSDAANFECNICFDLAQDPIVTLCGHLFCWPCLYKWLHIHSRSKECPVCKALIEEEKLVPLYGRGKNSMDPRSKSVPGAEIPHRPTGQRPETAPPPEPNNFPQNGFGVMGGLGGFSPVATARLGNFTLSAAFGGLFPSLFNIQLHGFPDATMYGAAAGFPYGYANTFHGGPHGFPQHATPQNQSDNTLKLLLWVIVWNFGAKVHQSRAVFFGRYFHGKIIFSKWVSFQSLRREEYFERRITRIGDRMRKLWRFEV